GIGHNGRGSHYADQNEVEASQHQAAPILARLARSGRSKMPMSAARAGACVRRPARSLAERARGLSSASSSVALTTPLPTGSKIAGFSTTIGMWREPPALPERSEKYFLTIRSSSEWK